MANQTASVSGDLSNPATIGGATWTDGDNLTINSNVVVDITDAKIIGASGVNGTVALTINQTSSTTWGTLRVRNGGTLALRGDCTNNGVVQVEGDGVLEFDSSLAASPASTKYKITLSNGGNPGVARFVTASTSASSRATVRSNAGGGNGYIMSAGFRGYVDCDYIDFLRVGDSTNDAISINANGNASQRYVLTHATLNACGRYGPGVIAAACQNIDVRLEYIISTNSQHATSVMSTSCAVAAGSGQRTIKYVGCDKAMIGTVALQGFAIDHIVVPAGFAPLMSGDNPPASMSHLWIRGTTGGTSLNVPCDITDSYLWIQPTSGTITNIHPVVLSPFRSITIDGLIMEGGDKVVAADGDWITGLPSTPATYTVKRCIAPPKGGGSLHAGQIVSWLGNSNVTCVLEHNTYVTSANAGESGGPSVGETYAGHAGMVSSCKSNLAVGMSAGTGVIFSRRVAGSVSDILAAANCSHNAVHNAANNVVGIDGYCDYGSPVTNAMFSTTTGLGANDVRADPRFVDSSRNLATWAVSRGSVASTYAAKCDDAQTYLQADPSLIADLRTHVRGGWAPTAAALRGAAHDGGDIGAIEMADAPSGGTENITGDVFDWCAGPINGSTFA